MYYFPNMICLTLSSPTIEGCLGEIERNREYIDMVELRADLLDESELENAKEFPSRSSFPAILTIRRTVDGGRYEKSEKDRRELFLSLLDGGFSYVDIESDVKRSDVEKKAKEMGVRIIRSYHDFEKVPDDIFSRIYRLKEHGDVAKVAVTPRSFQDVFTLFRIEEELKDVPKIVIGMGEFGIPTRILYKRVGSMLTFVSDGEVAPGQISPRLMKTLYRADKVDDRTAIYGVIGNPIGQTSSPKIHNLGFHAINFNAIYVPFLVDSIRQFFAFAEYVKMRGFSVTVPFKVDVLSYLGNISREVKQIGSCNTVVRVPGMWKGINTDYYGFIKPIEKDLDDGKIRNALVIGAGGASLAIVWALRNRGVKVTILNRTLSHAERVAKMNICQYDRIENASKYSGKVDLVVQTTSLGMSPNEGASPIPDFKFTGNEIAYDIIYKPKMTKFLQDAERAGSSLRFGSQMLLEQGKLQFMAFSGYYYPSWIDPEV